MEISIETLRELLGLTVSVSSGATTYCIVRSRDAGVFAGVVQSRTGNEVRMTTARRLWYWSGAASLSELAQYGVKRPADCKFPCEVAEITVLGVCEIIPCTEDARRSIAAVPVWSA